VSRRILVVDDEPGFRRMLEWNLGRDGVQVDTAPDGREAEKMLAGGQSAGDPYALVITDITMPHLDGLKLLRSVKRNAPATPVIMMTGFGTVETAVQAMKEGAADFVLKPFDLESMVARVRGILGLGAVEAPREK
jgi:DNA-binding NtrC family response regulator